MGRSKGDGNRSKNRPSSSNLAASLIQPDTTTYGFGGYVGSTRIDSTQIKSNHTSLDVDSEVIQHLRRLGKKDAVTKIKALTSLGALIKENPSENISQILPQWVFEYKRLVQDNSRQVRLAAQNVMQELATAVGKGLAPHLKSLMGAWWLSQFDPCIEVSEAAVRSFEVVFPAERRRLEVLIFCQNEIFLYLEENLKLTPQTILDRVVPLEELDEIHERVIASTLLALASLLEVFLGPSLEISHETGSFSDSELKLHAKTRSGATAAAERICHSHKYFKEMLKPHSPRLRSAIYKALTSFVKFVPQVFVKGDLKISSNLVLGTFQEKDPTCHSAMWDLLILFTRIISNAWEAAPVQKVVLPRFWSFLRHGCYGSQLLSYPCLLPMLSSIPADIISESFLADFFTNLWLGSHAVGASSHDKAALFTALKECFIWVVKHASRYTKNDEAAAEMFRSRMTQLVILKLLWSYYTGDTKAGISSEGGKVKLSQHPEKASSDRLGSKHPGIFLRDLGSIIIDLLSELHSLNPALVQVFGSEFQRESLKYVQDLKNEASTGDDLYLNRLSHFFSWMGERTLNQGKDWALIHIARPFIANLLPLIKTNVAPAVFALLSVIISAFGPKVLSLEQFVNEEGITTVKFNIEHKQEFQEDELIEFFKSSIVRWCLGNIHNCPSSKLDLLLSFLETPYIQSHWDWVVNFLAGSDVETCERADMAGDSDRIEVLAALLDRVRSKFIFQNASDVSVEGIGSEAMRWQSKKLDDIAVTVTNHDMLVKPSSCHLLMSVLGGGGEQDLPLISKEAVNLVIERLVKYLYVYFKDISLEWVEQAYLLVQCKSMELFTKSEDELLAIANTAAEILCKCFGCLKIIDQDSQLVPCILAFPFFFYWGTRMLSLSDDSTAMWTLWKLYENIRASENISSDPYHEESLYQMDELGETNAVEAENGSRRTFLKSVHMLWTKVLSSCKSFSLSALQRLQYVLIDMIRFIISRNCTFDDEVIVNLCCEWLVDTMLYTCDTENEEHHIVDHLLLPTEGWPVWAKQIPSCKLNISVDYRLSSGDSANHVHTRFMMLIDSIISLIGNEKVFFHSMSRISSVIVDETVISTPENISDCRFWLIVEILCRWKWPGGSAVETLVSLLHEPVQNGTENTCRIMLNYIADILFNCVTRKSTLEMSLHINAWVITEIELERISDPLLRSLVALLVLLFKDGNAWTVKDACRILLNHVLHSDFADKDDDLSSTKVLPHALQILIPFARNATADSEHLEILEQIQEFSCKWLSKVLFLPPMVSSKMQNPDVHNWVDIVVSCFPLTTKEAKNSSTVLPTTDISFPEKEMLLALFRRQSHLEAASEYRASAAERRAAIASGAEWNAELELRAELSLAKLISVTVGYCWKEFGESDWLFIFPWMRKWLDTIVCQVEELTEAVDDISKVPDASLDTMVEQIKKAVEKFNEFSMDLGEYAVFIFFLIHRLQNVEGEEFAQSLDSLKDANWERVETRSFEAVLRLLLATGIAEAIAASSCAAEAGGATIAFSRQHNAHFWKTVSEVVNFAPARAREAAVRAADLWGLSKGALNSLYSLLFSIHPHPSLQLAAFDILSEHPIKQIALVREVQRSLAEEVIEEDTRKNVEIDPSPDASITVWPELHYVLQLSSVKLLDNNLTSQTWVEYLLAWALFLTCVQSVPSQSSTRELLVQYIQDTRCCLTLLDTLFQQVLVNDIKLHGSKKKGNMLSGQATAGAAAAKRAAATGSVSFAVQALWPLGIEEITTLSGAIFGMMLRVFPAYVRDWFSSLRDRSKASAIETFTTAWCSPALLDEEFSQIQVPAISDDNLSIKANRSAREITSVYRREESYMDVTIRLPACYPLRIVEIECTEQLGVSETRLRKWILSMAAFVRNQNGAVAEAIQIWKRNIDRELEGVEECPICYSITHTVDHSLPRLPCKTCKHKFHAACIYRWFSTSNKSLCPLCQTPFR